MSHSMMSHYTVFLPAPSYADLRKDVRRTWVVEEHLLDISDPQAGTLTSRNDMEVDPESQGDTRRRVRDGTLHLTPLLSFREGLGIDHEKSINDDSAFLFGQRLSTLYDGAVITSGDLDEQYALSQMDEISKDSDVCDWSMSISAGAISTQSSEASVGPSRHEVPPSSSYQQPTESQDTSMEDESSEDITRDSSDASIARLPTFGIPINRLASIKQLMQPKSARELSASKKISILAGILDIDGPDYIRIKKGVDAGLEVALLKISMGDEDGGISKIIVWKELAEEWGQILSRGDVVLFRDVMFTMHSDGTSSFTASINFKPTATICYRTIPVLPEDRKLRPDLRIGMYDPAMARVARVVRWVRQMGDIGAAT